MRGVELADHHADDIVQLLRVADMVQERLVGGLDTIPIDAVHVGVIEAMLHDAPALAEDLLAFSAVVDFDAGGEVDAASGAAGVAGIGARSAGAAATPRGTRHGSSGRTGPVAAGAADARHIDAAILPEVERPSVLGVLQGAYAAQAAEATRGRAILLGRPRRLHDARQPVAVHADGPDGLDAAAALGAHGDEGVAAAVRRDGQTHDRVAAARQLPQAALDPLELNLHIDFRGWALPPTFHRRTVIAVGALRSRARARPCGTIGAGSLILAVDVLVRGIFLFGRERHAGKLGR